MSDRTCNSIFNNKPVTVTMGWDAPLQRYFMVVEYVDDEDVENNSTDENPNGTIYSNLDDVTIDENSYLDKSMRYFEDKLKELNITVPEVMINETITDGRMNRGNFSKHYN